MFLNQQIELLLNSEYPNDCFANWIFSEKTLSLRPFYGQNSQENEIDSPYEMN